MTKLMKCLLLIGACCLAHVKFALASGGAPSEHCTFFIVNHAKGMYLDVWGDTGAKDSNVGLWTSGRFNEDQQWYISDYSDGSFKIRNKMQDLCLDPTFYSGARDSNVEVYSCDGYNDQMWQVEPHESKPGVYKILNKAQGMCLDPADVDGASGRNVALYPCDGYDDQLWSFQLNLNESCSREMFEGSVFIVNYAKGMYLDVSGNTGAKQSNVGLWTSGRFNEDQQWYISDYSDGSFKIRNKMQDLCLDPTFYSGARDSNVEVYSCDGYNDQMWQVEPQESKPGVYKILNKAQGMCLDPADVDGASGRNVALYPCDGYDDQLWSFVLNPAYRVGPSYSYSYTTTGSWSSCSASCGGGTSTRSVTCKRSDGQSVSDSYCSGSKPSTSQSCNTQECVCAPGCKLSWKADGECDMSCVNAACNYDGGDCKYCDVSGSTRDDVDGRYYKYGSQTCDSKPVYYKENTNYYLYLNTNTQWTFSTKESMETCATSGHAHSFGGTADYPHWTGLNWKVSHSSTWLENPNLRVSCPGEPTRPASYTYSYTTGSWSSCSASCGGGTQTRSVTCKRSDGQSVSDSYCSLYVAGSKPSTSQSCNTGACDCSPGCPSSYLGDRECDGACNNAACNYDNGDCRSPPPPSPPPPSPPPPSSSPSYHSTSENCKCYCCKGNYCSQSLVASYYVSFSILCEPADCRSRFSDVCPSSGSSGSVTISYSSSSSSSSYSSSGGGGGGGGGSGGGGGGGGGGDNSGAIAGGIIAVLVIGVGAGAAFFLMSRAKKRHPDMSTSEAMRTELGEMMSSTKNDKGGTIPMAGQVMMAAPATQPVAMGMAVPPYTNTTILTVTPPPSAVVGTPQPVVLPGSTSPPFVVEPELAAAHEPVSNPPPAATVVPINIMPPTVESVLDAARVDKAKYLGPLQGLGVSTAKDLKDLTDADMDDVGLNSLAKRRLVAEINKL